MTVVVLLIAKTIQLFLRLTNKNGTALPGLVAEKLYPSLMPKMLSSLPDGVIIVTGTNGKTTTTKIVCELLGSQGKRVVSNPSGSNFTRGVYSALIRQGTLTGKLDYDIGVFELDEAYSRLFAKQIKPRAVLALNILRDQLDRYGEIDTTARHIGEAISHADMAILNANDPPVSALSESLKAGGTAYYFGVDEKLRHFLPSDEELHGTEEEQKAKAPMAHVTLTGAKMGGGEEHVTFKYNNESYKAHFPLEGVHNAQNAIAAVTTVKAVMPNADVRHLATALSRIHPAFGRGEQLTVRGSHLHIALVKNPGGFNQNLRAFVKKEMKTILIIINDEYADGRDTSWLWDVDFSPLKEHGATIMVGGIRAHDMALRLQYEDIPVAEITESVPRSLGKALMHDENKGDVLVFPTYTAMLEVRKALEKDTDVEGMW